MVKLPRLTSLPLPRLRPREIGRQSHFRRSLALACAAAIVWLLAMLGFAATVDGAMPGTGLFFWLLTPVLALFVFDRLQSSLDRSGGSER
jgi:hypothetical protein